LIPGVPDESNPSRPACEAGGGAQLSKGGIAPCEPRPGSLAPAPASLWAYRVCDVLTGGTLLVWAVQWAFAALRQPDWVSPAMAIFQAWVGVLLLVRSPVVKPARWIDVVLSAPSLLVSGLALKLAPDPSAWPAWNSVLFVAGAAWAMASLGWLGRSFAIFPASRTLVARGPYRLVRHPAYAGECAMILACALAGGRWTPALIPAAAATLVLRIRLEESALRAKAEYGQYAETVRWRLLPGVW
jgi:protein-S-isoprenylcysteine O-methyltransferase Ste14